MSIEISLISNFYDAVASTSRIVNNAIIAFKKSNLLKDTRNKEKYPQLKISSEDIETARKTLLKFLKELEDILSDTGFSSNIITSSMLKEFKDKLEAFPNLKEELSKLIRTLENNTPVENLDFKVLDFLASILDSHRSSIFRQIRTLAE